MIITVTGASGSGKTFVSNYLTKKFNAHLIEVDKIVNDIYKDKTLANSLVKEFGPTITTSNGLVSKALIANLVFSNKDKMSKLNELTWPYIESRIDKEISSHTNVIIDYKYIPFTKYMDLAKFNILVKASNEETRLKRIIDRDHCSLDYLLKRESTWKIDFSKYKFDYTLTNDYNSDFIAQLENLNIDNN